MVPLLFSPITVGPFELPNRMTVAPMCEYSANDGSASAWHTHQLMNNTMSGAELVMVEATAVERLGRLSHGCLGFYTYSNEAALAHLMADATKCRAAGHALWDSVGPLRAQGLRATALGGRQGFAARRGLSAAGGRSRRAVRARISDTDSPGRSRHGDCAPSFRAGGAAYDWALTSSKCIPHMAICWTTFSRPSPTSVVTTTAAAWKIA